ncbi:NAD(P)-binding protein [Cucurbitaria berberidis CBS 394.84]|uniref:NAD(P)-binding protein n=1 Tax=Cucurbitaria berberidis CBS 394.84 TaxID=1168544 RepID=A0A9P4GQY6_9PLEO|nr:NAD(P)-binding protein [Cucurbitaria berberidis CBS 394.84]KAF1850172.1 NAD(P)-binding protein [Cucurbitaria berberidis CBS 394.84]
MSKRSGPLAPGVAFIIGGARGLGNAVAVSFAKEGARGVVLVDIQDEQTFAEGQKNVEEYGTECLRIRADVTKEADVEQAVQQAVEKFGRIDYAANFAGILGPRDPISEISLPEWQKTQDVNSTGMLVATKYEMRQMMKQASIDGIEEGRVPQQGSIVNCASVNSLFSVAGTVAYTASKHACHGITKAAALEGRTHNIRVNAVSPGFLPTKLVEMGEDEEANEAWKTLWRGLTNRQGRNATLEEVGDVVVLLSLPRMSLVNAQNLFIDGGFTINAGNF